MKGKTLTDSLSIMVCFRSTATLPLPGGGQGVGQTPKRTILRTILKGFRADSEVGIHINN